MVANYALFGIIFAVFSVVWVCIDTAIPTLGRTSVKFCNRRQTESIVSLPDTTMDKIPEGQG